MIDRDHLGPVERAEMTEQDLAIASLVGRYVERREYHETPASTTSWPQPPSSATPPSTSCAQ